MILLNRFTAGVDHSAVSVSGNLYSQFMGEVHKRLCDDFVTLLSSPFFVGRYGFLICLNGLVSVAIITTFGGFDQIGPSFRKAERIQVLLILYVASRRVRNAGLIERLF